MRRLGSALLGLAIALAALPSPAVAATPNQLLDPKVSPGSGSTATAFTFSVRYASDRGWPALSVNASVAGKAIVLKRAAGTAVDGTWSASASLPAGTWPVTFSADAEQGPDPSVVGPTLTVTVAATPKPQPAATPKPPPAPTPQPAAPVPAPAQATPIPVPSTGSTPAGAATPGPVAPTVSPSGTPSTTVSSPSATLSSTQSPTSSRRPAPTADAAGTTGDGRNNEAEAAVLGIVALAALILAAGGAALLWSRLRSRSAAAPEPAASSAAAVRVDETPTAPSRRPRLDPIGPEDPILAAMGVGNEPRKES